MTLSFLSVFFSRGTNHFPQSAESCKYLFCPSRSSLHSVVEQLFTWWMVAVSDDSEEWTYDDEEPMENADPFTPV